MPQSFDEAFPGGFEECVSTLGQEPSVDDPEKLCGWLQEHGFEAIRNASPDSILAGLQVEYVSVVDEPAQDSEWLLAKSASADEANWTPGENRLGETRDLLLRKAEDDDEDLDSEEQPDEDDSPPERKVWAAVLVPGRADAHGDLIPEPEIESAAHSYMKHYRKVDADHSLFEGEGTPIESYIVRNGPEEFTTPDGDTVEYPEGTWIMGVELGQDAWKRVQNGELTGFSIYGGAASLDPDALLTEKQRKALRRAAKSADDAGGTPSDEQKPDPPRVELGTRRVSLRMGQERQDLLKQLGADSLASLAEALRAYFDENPDSTVTDTSVAEMFEWAADAELDALDDEVEVGGVVIPIRPSDDSDASEEEVEEETDEDDEEDDDAEEQSKNDADDDSPTMDDELKDTLGEIRDTTTSIAKSVEQHNDRLDELRNDLTEVQKEVGLLEEEESEETEADADDGDASKSDGEPSEIQELRADLEEAGVIKSAGAEEEQEEVDRKASKSGTTPDDVSKSRDDGTISTSAEGITAAGRVD